MKPKVLVVYREENEVRPYKTAVEASGAEPVLIKPGTPVSLHGFAGLLLTGGDDVNPARYGEPPHPQTEAPDDERDALECALIEEALARDVPLFGICRGLQVMNVCLGGSLIQHLPSADLHVVSTEDRGLPAHEARVEPGTLLASIAGSDALPVNSRHHQAINRLGTGLRITARDTRDGTIEAIEYPGRRFVLAVQWHPENQVFSDAAQQRLFRAFTEACAQ